jgi:hypothetical protein
MGKFPGAQHFSDAPKKPDGSMALFSQQKHMEIQPATPLTIHILLYAPGTPTCSPPQGRELTSNATPSRGTEFAQRHCTAPVLSCEGREDG